MSIQFGSKIGGNYCPPRSENLPTKMLNLLGLAGHFGSKFRREMSLGSRDILNRPRGTFWF